MNPDRRAALLRRREALQDTLRREARLASQQAAIEGVAGTLRASGTTHEILWSASGDLGWGWIEARFPLAFARVAWDEVPGATRRRWRTDAERDRLFREMLRDLAPDSNETVVVVWGNALRPPIRLSAAAVIDHGTDLLDADFDLWVYAPAGDWLVEAYHEYEHCAGRAPSGRHES